MASAWSKPGNRFQSRQRSPRLEELLPIRKFKSGVFYRDRFIGPPHTFAEHWIEIYKRDGNKVRLRKLCLAYDHVTGEFSGQCPYCDVVQSKAKIVTLQNVINRKLQKLRPAEQVPPLKAEQKLVKFSDGQEFYTKSKDSETWTPVEVVRLTSSPAEAVANMAATNTVVDKRGNEEAFGPEDIDYGFDIQMKYNEQASAANAYWTQKEARSPLTDAELDYHIYKLEVEEPESATEAQREAERLVTVLVDAEGVDTGGGGEAEPARQAGGRGQRRGTDFLDDLDEGEEPAADEQEEPEPAPRRRAAPAAAAAPARRRAPEPEDDEEEPPPRRSAPPARSATAPARRAAPAYDDEDEQEEPAPRRRAAAPPARRRSASDGLDLD